MGPLSFPAHASRLERYTAFHGLYSLWLWQTFVFLREVGQKIGQRLLSCKLSGRLGLEAICGHLLPSRWLLRCISQLHRSGCSPVREVVTE
jgi:hypothetical protein